MTNDDPALSVMRFTHEFGPLLNAIQAAASGDGIGSAEGRVITELRWRPTTAAKLGSALCMDRAQVSRLVKGLEAKGLVRRMADGQPSRPILQLTQLGDRHVSDLLSRQHAIAWSTYHKLSENQKGTLLRSAHELGEQLDRQLVEFVPFFRDAEPGDAGRLIAEVPRSFCGSHSYHESLEFEAARVLAALSVTEHFLLVAVRGTAVTGGLGVEVDRQNRTGHIRFFAMFLYEQGRGVGTKILHEAMARSKTLGLQTLTAELPAEAPTFYTRFNGWKRVSAEPKVVFGKKVEWESWIGQLSSD